MMMISKEELTPITMTSMCAERGASPYTIDDINTDFWDVIEPLRYRYQQAQRNYNPLDFPLGKIIYDL